MRLVQGLSAGFDTLPLDCFREMDIPAANNGGANSTAVAEHTVALILALYKQLLNTIKLARGGRPVSGLDTFELAGKVVGIVGLGNIGQRVALRVMAFEAKVQYFDIVVPPPHMLPGLSAVKAVSLDELMATSDIVSLHCPITPLSRGMISRERIALMKPTAILINTARGEVVDEEALYESLKERRIAGAGLDVLTVEPADPHNPLFGLDNVIITPHSAGTTYDTWPRRAQNAWLNISRVAEGQEPLWTYQE